MSTGATQDPTQAALDTASSPAASSVKNTLRTDKLLIVVKAGCSGEVSAGRFAQRGGGFPATLRYPGTRWKGYVPTGPVLTASVMTAL